MLGTTTINMIGLKLALAGTLRGRPEGKRKNSAFQHPEVLDESGQGAVNPLTVCLASIPSLESTKPLHLKSNECKHVLQVQLQLRQPWKTTTDAFLKVAARIWHETACHDVFSFLAG